MKSENSHTKKSILNFISTYFFYLLIAVLSIIRVNVFISGLGQDLYSLSQLYNSLFAYMTLLEAGVGVALVYRLYSLLSKKQYDKINKLYSGTVYIFRIIGLLIVLFGIILALFLPIFIKDNSFNYIFLISTFTLFILQSSIDYFFFVPRLILTAKNESYKINVLIYSFRTATVLAEIVLLYIGVNYLVVLIPGIIITLTQNYFINRKVYKLLPWLKKVDNKDLSVKSDISNVLVHRTSGIIQNGVDIVLLSAFTGAAAVVTYSAYNFVIKFATDTTIHIYQSFKDGIGNILALKDKHLAEESVNLAKTVFSFLAVIIVVVLYFSLNNFVTIWIGSKYGVSIFTLYLFLMIIFQRITNRAPLMIVNTLGLFKQTRVIAIVSAIVNVSVSLLLVFNYGINGVLIGTIIASYTIDSWAYSYVSAKYIFNNFNIKYWSGYIVKAAMIILAEIVILNLLLPYTSFSHDNNMLEFFINTVISALLALTLSIVLFIFLYPNFTNIINKVLKTTRRGQ